MAKYAYEPKGKEQKPRARERYLSDRELEEEVELAVDKPDRLDWLKKLRAEIRRRGL